MNYWNRKAMRDQLEEKIRSLRDLDPAFVPAKGWIRSIRDALGISARQLGRNVGIDQSRVSRLENAEVAGNLKLSSLQKIAKGMNMRFVYGFVLEKPLEELVRGQARAIATVKLKALHEAMAKEQQGLSLEEQDIVLNDMIEMILFKQPRDFWDKSAS